MKKKPDVSKHPICAEKARYVNESWRRQEGLPSIMQRANAAADCFDKRTINIDEDELICGNVASKPMGMEASVWGLYGKTTT